jgi:hypothetical protein
MPTTCKGKRKKGKPRMFSGNGEPYCADWEDIVKVLDEPVMELVGSRIYYIFHDM